MRGPRRLRFLRLPEGRASGSTKRSPEVETCFRSTGWVGVWRRGAMRWAFGVCSRCGGELHAKLGQVALVCLACGLREPLPRLPKIRGAADRANGTPGLSLLDGAVGLVEVEARSRRIIREAASAKGYQLIPMDRPSALARSGQSERGPFDLLMVEADRGSLAVKLAEHLRPAFPAAPVAIILNHWSEAETEAHRAAEFVLHAPLREVEVSRVLQIIEDYGGWLPAPLLASAQREGLVG